VDRFGQIGPEKGDYADDVESIADKLRFNENPVTFPLTHRMTRQQVTVALKDKVEVYGAGPEGTRGDGLWVFVAVDEKGAYWFRIDFLVEAGYAAAKLNLHPVDAETLVEFLALLADKLGHAPVEATSVVTQVLP
jgi:hypothetical protein